MTKELIKANPLQRDPQFIEWLNSGQRRYKLFIEKARRPEWSDIQVIEHYIKGYDIVIGVFKDAEYELGWGLYCIKGQDTLMRVINTGRAEAVALGVIPCRVLEEAAVFSQRYGDIKRSN
jgi:hypothetical protein